MGGISYTRVHTRVQVYRRVGTDNSTVIITESGSYMRSRTAFRNADAPLESRARGGGRTGLKAPADTRAGKNIFSSRVSLVRSSFIDWSNSDGATLRALLQGVPLDLSPANYVTVQTECIKNVLTLHIYIFFNSHWFLMLV